MTAKLKKKKKKSHVCDWHERFHVERENADNYD
jgi:hypothetical protein